MAKKRIPEVPRDGSEVDFIPENFMLIDGAEGSAKMRMDLFGKASTIEELDETKYEKPEDGIPKTDLAEGVQYSLGLADTALQASDIEGKQDLLHAGENIEITDDNVVNVINRTELLVDVPLAFHTVNDNLHLGLVTGNSVIPTPTVSDASSELVTDESGNIKWNKIGSPNGWALVNADDLYYGQVTYAKICELDMDYDTSYHACTTSFNVVVLNNGFDGDPVESGTVDLTFYSQSQANMARCEGRWSRYSTVLYRRRSETDNKNQLSIAGCFAILSSDRSHLEVWLKMTNRFNSLSTLAVSCTINTGAEMSYSYGTVYETYKNPWKYVNSHVYSTGTEPSVPSGGKSYVFDAYQQEYYDASQDEVTLDITDLSSATEFIVEIPAWVPLGKLSLNADMQISVSDVSSFTPCTVTITPVRCRYGTGDEAGYDPDVVISSGFTKDTDTGAQMGISCAMPIYDASVSYYWGTVADRFKISLDYTAPSGDRTASTATLKIRFRSAYGNCEARTTHGDLRATWNT